MKFQLLFLFISACIIHSVRAQDDGRDGYAPCQWCGYSNQKSDEEDWCDWIPYWTDINGQYENSLSVLGHRTHSSATSSDPTVTSYGGLLEKRPGGNNSLQLGTNYGDRHTYGLRYSTTLDGDNGHYLLNFAVVGGNPVGAASSALFFYKWTITTPSGSVTIGETLTYSSLMIGGVGYYLTPLGYGPVSVKYNDWKSVFFDFSSYPVGTTVSLEIKAADDLSGNWEGKFMMAYVEVDCISSSDSPITICSDHVQNFSNEIAANTEDQITHVWNFGDGTTSTDASPDHQFAPSAVDTSGNYVPYHVTLTVTLPNGQGGTTTSVIAVQDVIVIPAVSQDEITIEGPECGKFAEYTFSHPGTSTAGLSWVWDFGDGTTSDEAAPTHIYGALGDYEVTLAYANSPCSGTFKTHVSVTNCPVDCEDCITDFSLPAGDYVVSAWVKQEAYDLTTSYDGAGINVVTSIEQTFHPTGPIIDGWQRIEGVFEISDNSAFSIVFLGGDHETYFDDIRVFPYDGSMMSYVYDPNTLRLMAELDERNYAKFYEYDEEGKLIRVKKETEKGIMTIQENVENSVKKP